MKNLLSKTFIVASILLISFSVNAQFPGNISFTFSTDGDSEDWSSGVHGTASIWEAKDGHLSVQMVGADKYRADLLYNSSDGTNNKGTASALTFNMTTDKYIAIKFIGDRPNGNIKFEMSTTGNVWLNSGGGYGSNVLSGDIATSNGNKIYYLDLSANSNFTGESIDIDFIKFIIADAAVEPYEYTVDWIATFPSVASIIACKDIGDDGADDNDDGVAKPEKVQSFYFTFTENSQNWNLVQSQENLNVADGHFSCTAMALQGNGKYRADMKYASDITVVPEKDKIIAIKFIDDRPNGALKFEMQKSSISEGGWFNGYNNPTGSIITSYNNTIYYFDLTTRADYIGTDPLVINTINFVIADAEVEPYSYSVDWIATFESVEDLQAFKDYKDDGATDNDENTGTPTWIETSDANNISVYSTASSIVVEGIEKASRINIYNISGNLVLSTVADAGTASIPFSQKGAFIVDVMNDGNQTVVKLIK